MNTYKILLTILIACALRTKSQLINETLCVCDCYDDNIGGYYIGVCNFTTPSSCDDFCREPNPCDGKSMMMVSFNMIGYCDSWANALYNVSDSNDLDDIFNTIHVNVMTTVLTNLTINVTNNCLLELGDSCDGNCLIGCTSNGMLEAGESAFITAVCLGLAPEIAPICLALSFKIVGPLLSYANEYITKEIIKVVDSVENAVEQCAEDIWNFLTNFLLTLNSTTFKNKY